MDRDRGWETVALTGAPIEHVRREHTRNRRMAPPARPEASIRAALPLRAYVPAGSPRASTAGPFSAGWPCCADSPHPSVAAIAVRNAGHVSVRVCGARPLFGGLDDRRIGLCAATLRGPGRDPVSYTHLRAH